MSDMETFETARLVQRYRRRAGFNIVNKNEAKARRPSLANAIKEKFPETTLTGSRLTAIESQNPKRHQEPTPKELYQLAIVMNVPMTALIVDAEDPYAPCQIANADGAKNQVENRQVIDEQVLQWGATDNDDVGIYVINRTYTSQTDDPFSMIKYANESHLISQVLPAAIKSHPTEMTTQESHGAQYQDEQSAGLMMEEIKELQINGVDIPDEIMQDINNALQQVREYWESRRRYAVPLDEDSVRRNNYDKKFGLGEFKPRKGIRHFLD